MRVVAWAPAVPAATRRGARAWLALLFALVLGLAGCTIDESFGPQVLTLTQGEVLEAGSAWPVPAPADDAPWQPVTLPDAWDTSRPDFQGYVWYRLRFDTQAAWSERLAVYLPAVSMNALLVLNGRTLGVQGRMDEPITRNFYTPLIVPLPPALLRPAGQTNELRVLVVGYRSYRSGLAPVHVGEAQPLQAAWSVRRFWQNTGTLITSVVVLALAVYSALLWARARRSTMYAWFTLAALVWGARNLNFVLTDNPWDNLWWNQASLLGASTFVGLLALFTLEYRAWVLRRGPPPRWQRALPLGYVLLCLLLVPLPADTALLRDLFLALGAGGMVLTLWSQWHMLAAAWQLRTATVTSVALAGLVYLALLVHDFLVAADRTQLGQLFVRQYAAVPLFVAVTMVWTQRYWQAFGDAERLSRGLQHQVAAQRQVLERNYEQLVAAERERVLSQERERLVSDLHDGLGLHLLTALKMAREPDASRETLADTLQDCLDDLRVAIDSMSNLDERDPVLLLASLRFRIAPRLQAAGVQLDWQVDGEVAPQPWLDAPRALHLLRVVQEALTNAVRHGRATRVLLKVEAVGPGVAVSVIDDGIGLGVPSGPRGLGIASMGKRASMLGAQLTVASPARGGTEVRLFRPA